jgi:hypothetical protein
MELEFVVLLVFVVLFGYIAFRHWNLAHKIINIPAEIPPSGISIPIWSLSHGLFFSGQPNIKFKLFVDKITYYDGNFSRTHEIPFNKMTSVKAGSKTIVIRWEDKEITLNLCNEATFQSVVSFFRKKGVNIV